MSSVIRCRTTFNTMHWGKFNLMFIAIWMSVQLKSQLIVSCLVCSKHHTWRPHSINRFPATQPLWIPLMLVWAVLAVYRTPKRHHPDICRKMVTRWTKMKTWVSPCWYHNKMYKRQWLSANRWLMFPNCNIKFMPPPFSNYFFQAWHDCPQVQH